MTFNIKTMCPTEERGGRHFLSVFIFENLINYFILTIMSDTGTDSDCTICVTNNGDVANVDKDFDLNDISVSSEGTVDLRPILAACLNQTITMAM